MEQKIMIQDAMAFAGYCYAIVDTQTGTISFKKKNRHETRTSPLNQRWQADQPGESIAGCWSA